MCPLPFSIAKPKKQPISKSNSNSLANQLGIHLILAKREKLASNPLANQLSKNRPQIVVAIGISL
jgi:hypothetical protein